MAAQGYRFRVLALTCVMLVFVGYSRGSLMLTMETYDDKNFCANLNCRIKDSSEEGLFFITSLTLYNTSRPDERIEMATVKNDGNGIRINQSKTSEMVGAGCINRYDADLSVSLINPYDCYFGKFLCELDYIDTDGHSDTIITDVNGENASNECNCGTLSSQLSKVSRRLDNTTRHLHTLTQNFTVELVALRQQNLVLFTQFQNVSQELTLIKDQQISLQTAMDAVKTNEQSKQASTTRACIRGMETNITRVKFLLWGQIPAVCDTETDGGGWVLIQRRTTGNIDFYRDWQSYKTGFGTPDTDFWLGNDVIHNLTLRGYSELRVDMILNKTPYYAQYDVFTVKNENLNYQLTVAGYRGTAGDSLTYHNYNKFSTYDRDNDEDSKNCASTYHGAWWYHECYESNLNGAWGVNNLTGVIWQNINLNTSLNFTEIKVRLWDI